MAQVAVGAADWDTGVPLAANPPGFGLRPGFQLLFFLFWDSGS
jgi:hypothetical protein